MDVEKRMYAQYNTNFTHVVSEIDANRAVNGTSEFSTNMVFKSHEHMTDWVKTKGRSLGYGIIIRSKKQDNGIVYEVVLMCNRGGIDKSKNLTTDKTSKKINCPFQLEGKFSLWECGWTLQVICEKHNHEPALDKEGRPYDTRLLGKEYRLVLKLCLDGLKPQAILSILKERHPDNLSTIRTINNVLRGFPKSGNAGTLMGDTVNDQEPVSLSPESNPYASDAKRIKRNVDHTAPFATGNWVRGLDPAKHGSLTKDMFMFSNGVCHDTNAQNAGPFQPYRDVAFYKPKGQFSNDSLSMDVDKQMNAQYNTNFTHLMRENERSAAVKSEFSADMSMHVGNRMKTRYNTSFTQTVCENERTHVVNGTSEFSTNMSQEHMTDWVKIKGRSLGYGIIIRSKKQEDGIVYEVVLMCNRGGIDKSKNLITHKTSKKINCPFQLVGKFSLWECGWTLQVICEKHNHEPALDKEGRPYDTRLLGKEYRLVLKLCMDGLKPQAILSILKERHPDNLSTIRTINNVLRGFPKFGNAGISMGDKVNDQKTVSPSPESNPYAFDAKRMKRNIDHTASFATGVSHDTNAQDVVAIAVSAEDEPTFRRPFQPYRDLAFFKPKGKFSNDSLSMDGEKRMNVPNFTLNVRK